MILLSILYGMVTGNAAALIPAALTGAGDAISLTLRLLAGYLFFCGMIEIVNALNIPARISRALSPLLRFLFPSIQKQETKDAIVMNFSANILGLGNAATPMGILAMERMEAERAQNNGVLAAMYMFLIINATSLQLIPTTVISMRMAAGSASPTAVLFPTILCTVVSTVAGVLCALVCARVRISSHAVR
jgi:spore maturation protein A